MNKLYILILSGCAAWTFSTNAADIDWSKLPPAATKTGLTFTNDIQPIFQASCVRCHSANRPRAQLRLDTLAGVLKGTEKGLVLTAGDSANSLLVKAVSQLDPETAMPPKPRARRGPGGVWADLPVLADRRCNRAAMPFLPVPVAEMAVLVRARANRRAPTHRQCARVILVRLPSR